MGVSLDRDFRNDYNQNIEDIEEDMKNLGTSETQALEAAAEALEKAGYAQEKADYAQGKAEEAGQRLVELEDVDAVQFHERQNQLESQLAQNVNDYVLATHPPIPYTHLMPDSEVDQTDILQALYSSFDYLLVPKGEYIINGMFEMNKMYKGVVILSEGAVLKKTATATNTDPVVWINGYGTSLIGVNRFSSEVRSEVDSPYGVVRIGYENMDDLTPRSVYYNQVKTLNIRGKGVNQTGVENRGLYIVNPEVNDQPSYFNDIDDLIIRHVNSGIVFEGWANANTLGTIQFLYVGNEKYLNGASVKFIETDGKYPTENTINKIVQGGGSNNAAILRFEGESYANVILGIVGEPGGGQSVLATVEGIKHRDNVIIGSSNTVGGLGFGDDFYNKNTILIGSFLRTPDIKTSKLVSDSFEVDNIKKDFTIEKSFRSGNFAESKGYGLVEILTGTNNDSLIIDLNINLKHTTGLYAKTATIKFGIKISSSGAITTSKFPGYFSDGILIEPVISGNKVTLGIRTPLTGGATVAGISYTDVKIVGANLEQHTFNFIEDNSVVVNSPAVITDN